MLDVLVYWLGSLVCFVCGWAIGKTRAEDRARRMQALRDRARDER